MPGTLTIELGFGFAKCPSISGTLVVPQTLVDSRRVRICSCTIFLDISTPISLPSHHFLLLIHPHHFLLLSTPSLPPSNPPHHFLLLIHHTTSYFYPPRHFLLLIHPTTSSF